MANTEILDRYRRLRAISTHHHSTALDHVARPAFMGCAKHLGLAYGQALLTESEEEMTLIFDLAVHTAKPGRSRAIDRYARATAFPPGSDEARTLDAIRSARFSIWRIERHHVDAGVIVTDVLREREVWLVDEALTASAQPGLTFASRLCWPAEFAMTCGVVVPVDAEMLEDVMLDNPVWLQHGDLHQWADDLRFATAIYRAALDIGIIDHVRFMETEEAA